VRKWHFQIVPSDLGLRQTSAPILLDANVNGKIVKVVAVPSKQSILRVRSDHRPAAFTIGAPAQQSTRRWKDSADAAVPDQAAGLRTAVAESAGSDRLPPACARGVEI
jgi:glucose dehydrogenase